MRISALGLAAVLACACGEARPTARATHDDALVLDCVGDWHSGPQVLKLWGDHPDYEPDYATAYRTDDRGAKAEELRYHVAGDHLRLWRHHGREVADVPFTLVRDEAGATYRYQLRLDAPVFGQRVYQGDLSAAYHCAPRTD